ncbi:HNH/endonuclease VII fold putative polymorphic toxin, partial [Clostridium frigidicarnis]
GSQTSASAAGVGRVPIKSFGSSKNTQSIKQTETQKSFNAALASRNVNGAGNPVSRKQALSEINKDLGISKSQHPLEQKMVPLLDENKKRILDANNNFVETRELTYSVQGKFDVQGNPIDKVVIQDHSYGHYYNSGIGNQPSHFNVRPSTNTKNGAVQGMKDHYYFNYRNKK